MDTEKDLNPGKQKRFWSFIKSLRKDNCRVAPIKENGKMDVAPKDNANIPNRQYESTFTREDTSNIQKTRGESCQPMPNIIVTEEGVAKLLRRISPNKTCGPDMIPAMILTKDLAEEISLSLTVIFQKSHRLGYCSRWLVVDKRFGHFQESGSLQSQQQPPRVTDDSVL